MTYTLTVTSQGQVSIPAEVRKLWGIVGNGHINLTLQGNKKGIVEPIPDFLSLAGTFHSGVTKGMTPSQILEAEKKAIEEGYVEHYLAKEKRSGNKLLKIKTW